MAIFRFYEMSDLSDVLLDQCISDKAYRTLYIASVLLCVGVQLCVWMCTHDRDRAGWLDECVVRPATCMIVCIGMFLFFRSLHLFKGGLLLASPKRKPLSSTLACLIVSAWCFGRCWFS